MCWEELLQRAQLSAWRLPFVTIARCHVAAGKKSSLSAMSLCGHAYVLRLPCRKCVASYVCE